MADLADGEGLAGEETPLFVYGTLKRGQPNHARLEGARWLGEAWLEGACLYDLGPFPMAIAAEGVVFGEVYAVALAALPLLDAFEGCPRLYARHWLALADGRQAWVYLGRARQVRHSRRLPAGVWPPVEAVSAGFDTLGACQAWRHSRGLARLELANAIGAAHALTKRHPFTESTAEKPVALYEPADVARVCGRL